MLASGNSSLAIWTPFNAVTTASSRILKARCMIAWTRNQIVNAFAIIGTSRIAGTDIVQGVGDNVLNDADLYEYFDETDRLIHMEYERHLIEPLGGAAVAMATIVLDNTDLKLSPNYDSTIGTAIKPNRPIKLFMGFEVNGQEVVVPIIEALSMQPKEDKIKRQVTIQCEDFVTFLDNLPQETSIYIKQRTDQIIGDILARAGIGSSNYKLDQGLNTPGFAGFGVGDYAGISIQNLCQAEEGVFYQDELGIFRFENRLKNSQAPYTQVQWKIDEDDILEWAAQDSSQIINHMLISGQPRSVKGEVQVWNDGQEEVVPSNGTIIVWAQFNDPVTALEDPEAEVDYQAFTQTGSLGSDITGSVTITVDVFTTTAKLTIKNTNANAAYIPALKLRGSPATVDYDISEVYEDGDSVALYNVQQQQITNDYIQSSKFAENMARDIVLRYKDPNDILQIKIRGVPQLQLRDRIQLHDPDLDTYNDYRLIGIAGVFDGGSFVQTLTLRLISPSESISGIPVSSIQDDWSGGIVNQAIWSNWGYPQTSIIAEQLHISSILAGGYFGVDTNLGREYYNLTSSFLVNQLVDAGNTAITSWEVLPVQISKWGDVNNYQAHFIVAGGNLLARKVSGGVTTALHTVAYNAAQHKWFRIREANGTIYFETSVDGKKWVLFTSAVSWFDITKVIMGQVVGTWQAEASTTAAVFDNFNILPT